MSVLLLLLLIKTIAIFTSIKHLVVIEILFVLMLLTVTIYFKASILNIIALFIFSLTFIVSPILLFLCLAFLHNLTPWGFLLEQKAAKKAWLIFIINPILVFVLSMGFAIDTDFYTTEQSHLYLSHYLVSPDRGVITIAFFASAVYLQLIHYYYVIKVLPTFCKTPIKLNILLVSLFLLLAISFLYDFQASKKLYSLMAMVHAYLEIPLLLYLLPKKEGKIAVAPVLERKKIIR
ncbi:Uncharacterised protein [Legionella lansingensis]|uniref:Uncharacterized protein n=1 Tax=Legionella lansingensis TaxID=45067 RepID=A0A0W0VTJ6_9GAMM|nr:hypothetical protein [Legionella lansingensis]KTD23391.1 hypothetical protein Llan_0890 [Legionella lansingensis]SNV49505.1 Uncharacterised protein [Legionella lansingensis]